MTTYQFTLLLGMVMSLGGTAILKAHAILLTVKGKGDDEAYGDFIFYWLIFLTGNIMMGISIAHLLGWA